MTTTTTNILFCGIADVLLSQWKGCSIVAKIFEQLDEDLYDEELSFPFTCNLLTDQSSVDVQDCLLDVKEKIWCSRETAKLDDYYCVKYLREILLKVFGIYNVTKILIEKELKYAIKLLDCSCREYPENNIIKISQNEVDFNLSYVDDALDTAMGSLDENGGLGNILVNPDTMKKLKQKRLLQNDFLHFILEEANGGILIHDSIPRNTIYALVAPHNLGPILFEGFSIDNSWSADKVFFNITEHVGFMIANPRGIRKIIWS